MVSDVSRGIARLDDGDGATAERALAAARSPSEVKVRRVGTGCARIHFFGLALDFFSFFPAGEARGISSHVCTDLAYMAGTMRYPLPSRVHSLVCISRSSLSLFLAHSLVRSPVLLAHRSLAVYTHVYTRSRLPFWHTYNRPLARTNSAARCARIRQEIS